MCLCVLLALALAVRAQQPQPEAPQQPAQSTATPAPAPDTAQTRASSTTPSAPAQTATPAADAAQAPTPTQPPTPDAIQQPATEAAAQPAGISEEELKQMLAGKQIYLRGGYLGDSLAFDEHGRIIGHSPQGSYTLSVIQIDHVRLTKHKVELEGERYGMHFNEQLAYEDSSTSFDKVRITPKKKVVKITIDREMVVNPKKKKESSKEKGQAVKAAALPAVAAPSGPNDQTETSQTGTNPTETGQSEADQLKASIAAAPEAERAADPSSVTTTTSQAHANRMLRDALGAVFAPSLDQRMMAAMPDFWKLYYQAVAAKADYRPADPAILRQNTVDQKAHLLTSFEPDSNDFAQAAGVAGMALYHTVIGADGKPGEIAVARPIGFGLDENAVAAIRKAKFSPAIKDGKPVPVMLDLVVQFRIFSKRTAAQGTPETADAETAGKDTTAQPVLPGPYSVPHH
ncbi:MAG TPA: energy transducer TonB [Terracidiphilus sp.]|jgi:TonB family protein